MPADAQGSVQDVSLFNVPADVLSKLLIWFSQVKQLECDYVQPLQEVQCVRMYSVWYMSQVT